MKIVFSENAPRGSGRKHLRKLVEEQRKIAVQNSGSPAFQVKFTHPRRRRKLRGGLSILASPYARMLREWRRKNNWYVKEAANTIGVPFDTYRGWEAGRHLPSTLAKNAIRACMQAYPGS